MVVRTIVGRALCRGNRGHQTCNGRRDFGLFVLDNLVPRTGLLGPNGGCRGGSRGATCTHFGPRLRGRVIKVEYGGHAMKVGKVGLVGYLLSRSCT